MTRDDLRAHLDRKPPPGVRGNGTPWREWFDADGEYLGERSGRTGSDIGTGGKACGCEVCESGRQTATVAPGRVIALRVVSEDGGSPF